MVKLDFQNVVVKDTGYGLTVNGKSLEDIISTALGTKLGDHRATYGSPIKSFESNCCNISILIDPQPVTEHIETDSKIFDSVEILEEDAKELYGKLYKKDGEE